MKSSLRSKTRAITVAVASMAAFGLTLSGCAGSPAPSADASEDLPAVTLRIAHGFTSTSTEQNMLLEVADMVSERTEGKLTLQIFSDAALGSNADVLEQAVSGGDVIAFVDGSSAAEFGAPELEVVSGPFLFDSTEEANALIGTDIWNEWMGELEEKGNLKVLAMNWFDQPRDILGTAAYSDPEDMEGVKIRVPPLDAWTKTFEAVGAVPTSMGSAEVYSAIEQGVVNAGESAPNAMYAFQWHDVAKHLTRTGHILPYLGFGMSAAMFDGLPVEYQKVLTEEFTAGGERITAIHLENTEKTLELMRDAGVTVHDADIDSYRELAAPYYDDAKHSDWRPGLLDLVRDAAQANK